MKDEITHEQMRHYVLWEAQQLVRGGKWVVVDTETTSLDQPHIVQWAVCGPDGEVLGEGLVKPPRYVRISKEAQAKHGLTRQDLLKCPTFDQVAPQIVSLLQGNTFVAYNAEFDQGSLLMSIWPYYERDERHEPVYRYFYDLRRECAMHWFAVLYGERGYNDTYRYKSLEVACAHFNIPRERSHHATHDARATVALIHKMAALSEQGVALRKLSPGAE